MLDKFKNMGWKKFYLIYAMCDETFSVNYSAEIPADVDRGWFYFWVSLFNQIYWVGGATLGGLLGNLITFDTKGLDFVMTAMFVVIFMEQWKKEKNHMSELIGMIASVVCLLIFGADNFLVPTMVMIAIIVTVLLHKWKKQMHVSISGGTICYMLLVQLVREILLIGR